MGWDPIRHLQSWDDAVSDGKVLYGYQDSIAEIRADVLYGREKELLYQKTVSLSIFERYELSGTECPDGFYFISCKRGFKTPPISSALWGTAKRPSVADLSPSRSGWSLATAYGIDICAYRKLKNQLLTVGVCRFEVAHLPVVASTAVEMLERLTDFPRGTNPDENLSGETGSQRTARMPYRY